MNFPPEESFKLNGFLGVTWDLIKPEEKEGLGEDRERGREVAPRPAMVVDVVAMVAIGTNLFAFAVVWSSSHYLEIDLFYLS